MSAYLSDTTRKEIDDRLRAATELGYSAEAETSSDPSKYYEFMDPNFTKRTTGMLADLKKSLEPQELNIGGGATSAAIQKRADKKFYNPETEQTKRKLSYLQNTSNQLNRAKTLALGQYRLDNAAAMAEMNRNAQENAQRNAVIGQVLGVGGMIVGGAIAGPAGAMVGGGMGNAAASGMNSNQYGYGQQQQYLGANTQFKGGY